MGKKASRSHTLHTLYTAGSKPVPSPYRPHIQLPTLCLSGEGEDGEDYGWSPLQGQLLDPPPSSTSIFPLPPGEVQTEASQDSARQNLNL